MYRYYCLCFSFLILFTLSGCFSPTYVRPELLEPTPASYKYADVWRQTNPALVNTEIALDRNGWWKVFEEPTLNKLMVDLNQANQRISIAAANYRYVKAQAGVALSDAFPSVGGTTAIKRGRSSANNPIQETYNFTGQASWEISLWNALMAYEAAFALETASAADYAAIKLGLQTELAQTYFQLRVYDEQIALYKATIETYAKEVKLTKSQFEGGMVTAADVAQSETQLSSTIAQLADLEHQRATYETTLAVLTGRLASSFTLEAGTIANKLPILPQELPSALLERRPDIIAAERQVASANEEIGLARAAWFPTFTIGGQLSRQGVDLFTAPITVWTLGPSAALNIFQGGKRIAATNAAWANYEKSAANYRQVVLEGFKEVEDSLSALTYLEQQIKALTDAVNSSRTAFRLSLSQYQGGLITYVQVVTTQTRLLTNERTAIQAQGQRLISYVQLIKALGGGWNTAAIGQLMQGNAPQEGVAKKVW